MYVSCIAQHTVPSEEFELTANTLQAHMNKWKLTQAHFEATHLPRSKHTRQTHTVTLLWAFCQFATHTVSLLLGICEINQWAHCDLTVTLTVRHSGEPRVSMALAHIFTGYR